MYSLISFNMQIFPIMYVKICPLSAWGAGNHVPSIYYVEFLGENDPQIIKSVENEFSQVSINQI
jgi:hypothetical protein